MEEPVFDKSTSNSILNQIDEGMRVYDREDNEIGTVRKVFLGSVTDEMNERGGGPATASSPEVRDDTLVDNLAEAFAGDEPLPETVRERLLRHGFIRIDVSGLFASDRFAMPEQIATVSDDRVRLRLTKEELDKLVED
jgi:hypothetical protein